MDISSTFTAYGASMDQDFEVRESVLSAIRDMDKVYYSVNTNLERIHSSKGIQNIEKICQECQVELCKISRLYAVLSSQIPFGEFYKYHYNFRGITQKLCFVAALIVYLLENRLVEHKEVSSMYGLKEKREDGFHLDLEDYLIGCLGIGHELGRLSVNCVSSGDYTRPYQISQFLRDLHSAYSLLNPKHELRKKFDELKYAVKKAEEVVYNLSLRGLKPQDCGASG